MTAQAMFNLKIGPVGPTGRPVVDLGMKVTEAMLNVAMRELITAGL